MNNSDVQNTMPKGIKHVIIEKLPLNLQRHSKRKKSVRFASKFHTKTYRTIALSDMSISEKQSVWYNKDFYDLMQSSIYETVLLMSKGDLIENEEGCNGDYSTVPEQHCSRGLESSTPAGAKNYLSNVMGALSTVMNEQQKQRKLGLNNPEKLASVYGKFSKKSARSAWERGQKDQQAIATHNTSMQRLYRIEIDLPRFSITQDSVKSHNEPPIDVLERYLFLRLSHI